MSDMLSAICYLSLPDFVGSANTQFIYFTLSKNCDVINNQNYTLGYLLHKAIGSRKADIAMVRQNFSRSIQHERTLFKKQ